MKTRIFIVLSVACACALTASPLKAQKDDEKKAEAKKDEIHNELRALRDGLTEAVLKGDTDKQLTFVSKDVVVTWQNGEVARGHSGLKEFLSKGAQSKAFQGYKDPPTPTELTILYGDSTGISYGTSVGKYSVVGQHFELKNHWSATLVKEEGRWVIASYHVSGNLLDNPLLNTAKSYLYWVGGIALVVGLVLGWIVSKLMGKTRGPGA
jgi:hypothetical protein